MPRIIKENSVPEKPIFSRRTIIIASVVVCVLVAAGIGIWKYVQQPQDTAGEEQDPVYLQKVERLGDTDEALTKISPIAQQAIDAGDIAALEEAYKQAIAEYPDSPHVQTSLYIGLAQSFIMLQDDGRALEAARQAEKLDLDKLHERIILPLIGYTAYRVGDRQLALDYLRRNYEFQKTDPYIEAGVLNESKLFLEQLESEL